MANQNRKRQPRRQPSRSSTPIDYDDYDDAADDTNFEVDGYPDEETELEEDQFERFRKKPQSDGTYPEAVCAGSGLRV